MNASYFNRRTLLLGGCVTAAAAGAAAVHRLLAPHVPVFIADHQQYDARLQRTIQDGLIATGINASALLGKRVLLKPNLVEPTRTAPHMTTHPLMVRATAEVFRRWGAEVIVGEAPGHVRDTDFAVEESGLGAALRDDNVPFADLNYEDSVWMPNAGRASSLKGFYFPQTVVTADLIVTMPKMKTHHWMGVTASLKNMYGVLPGLQYGWPKNVLHHAGIPETVFDINASLPQVISVVDAIECMEGDGPIMGSAKHMGLVIVGTNATAVDATVCRLMGIEPYRVEYLKLAANELGPLSESHIEQRGCQWKSLAKPFAMLDRPHLNVLRGRLVT